MNYTIYNMVDILSVDFSQVEETSQDTLRLSIDKTKTVLKFNGDTPSFLDGKTILNRNEMLIELKKEEWQSVDE